jgi:hypothetical protein
VIPKYIIFLLFICLGLSANARCEDWIGYGSHHVGLFLYDKDSVSKDEKGMISVTQKNLLTSETARAMQDALPDLKGVSFMISYDTIDCERRIYECKRTLYYDKLGNIIYDTEPNKEKYRTIGFRPIPVDSPVGRVADIVCK